MTAGNKPATRPRYRDSPAIHAWSDASPSGMAGRWPLWSCLELGAFASAVPCARLHARQLMWEWRLAHLAGEVELLVCEILTNALAASWRVGNQPVRLWLASDARQVLILVWDASLQPPVRSSAAEDEETGRGLMLVEAVSERWGWYPDMGGKVVWAAIGGESRPIRESSPVAANPVRGTFSPHLPDR